MAVWRRLRPSKGRCPAPHRRAAPALGLRVVMTLLRARLRTVGGRRFVPGRSAHVRSEATVSGSPLMVSTGRPRLPRDEGGCKAGLMRPSSVSHPYDPVPGTPPALVVREHAGQRRFARPRREPWRPLAPQVASGGSLVGRMPMLWTGCSRSAPDLSGSTSAALATCRRSLVRLPVPGAGPRARRSPVPAAWTPPGPGSSDDAGVEGLRRCSAGRAGERPVRGRPPPGIRPVEPPSSPR